MVCHLRIRGIVYVDNCAHAILTNSSISVPVDWLPAYTELLAQSSVVGSESWSHAFGIINCGANNSGCSAISLHRSRACIVNLCAGGIRKPRIVGMACPQLPGVGHD